MEQLKDLNYWKKNAEEDYMKVPISVLRYITELESALRQHGVMTSVCPSCNGKLEKTSYNYVQCDSCEKTYRQTDS